jgi:KaiC/GvpD/RAD55 family RecA-like ATPase
MGRNNLKLHAFLAAQAKEEAGVYRGVLDKAINPKDIERIPTGIRSIDATLHGGIPRGQLSLVVGQTHTGKSTLSIQLMAKAILRDKPVLYLGYEAQPGEIHFELQRMLAGPGRMNKTGPGEWGVDSTAAEKIDRFLYDGYLTLRPRKNGHPMPMAERHEWTMRKMQEFVDAGGEVIVIDPMMQFIAQMACSPVMRSLKTDNERQSYIGMTLEDFAITNNVWVIMVCHYKKGGVDAAGSGPDAVNGSSVVPNSAGVIISYERFSEVWKAWKIKKIKQDIKSAKEKGETDRIEALEADIKRIECKELDDKRQVKIWKNRGWGKLELGGIETGFDDASHRIGSHDPDYWDDKYDYEKIMNSPEWHDYMDDPIDPVTAKTNSELQTEAEALIEGADGDIQAIIEAMERSIG